MESEYHRGPKISTASLDSVESSKDRPLSRRSSLQSLQELDSRLFICLSVCLFASVSVMSPSVCHGIHRSAMLMSMHDRHKKQLEEEKKCWKETIMFVESYLKLPQVWNFSDKDQNTLTKEVPHSRHTVVCSHCTCFLLCRLLILLSR